MRNKHKEWTWKDIAGEGTDYINQGKQDIQNTITGRTSSKIIAGEGSVCFIDENIGFKWTNFQLRGWHCVAVNKYGL
jgi:hypothetical protein